MMTRRSLAILAVLAGAFVPTLSGQATLAISRQPSAISAGGRRLMADGQRDSFRRSLTHNGKWLTAASVVALVFFAEREHSQSRREWNALLDICRSAQDACALGSDGRYLRSDAEALYQRSRAFDRRANRWLLGAQAGLLATTALFIIDLRPGEGPENIPFAPMQVGLRIPF
jgi:hypothetical protein